MKSEKLKKNNNVDKNFMILKEDANKFNKNQKGITLIALIITIIVLLILAGVTISLILGENGLISTTKKATTSYEEQQAKEKLETVLLGLQADKISKQQDYNDAYIDKCIQDNKMEIDEENIDIILVDGWQFQIDRGVPKIVASLGKGENNIDKDRIKNAHYLYYKGEEYIKEGGEWINSPKSEESSLGQLTKEKDSMVFEAKIPTRMNPVCTKEQPLDISAYDKINIEIEVIEENLSSSDRNIGIDLLNKNSGLSSIVKKSEIYFPKKGKESPKIGEKVVISMEIVDLNNLQEVYFGLSVNGYKIKIYSIYLEKYEHEIQDLYNLGNEYSTIGGKWINSPKSEESNLGELTKERDSMVFEAKIPTRMNPVCTKEQSLNISGYDKISIEIEVVEENFSSLDRNIGIDILNKNSGLSSIVKKSEIYFPKKGKESPKIGEKVTISMMITEEQNLEEVYFGLSINGYKVKIYRIWLDKITK